MEDYSKITIVIVGKTVGLTLDPIHQLNATANRLRISNIVNMLITKNFS